MGAVSSKDGTSIAYERSGSGPVMILISAALSDRSDHRKLARQLADTFTVINYDRRGRGLSGDTPPYAVEREVEDIGALIEIAGSPAYLFGSSSGAVLALEAAQRLGSRVRGLFLYEPPLIVEGSRAPVAKDFAGRIAALVAAGKRSQAVRLFFTEGMGIPGPFVTLMRWLMPGWKAMAGMAHTLPYDLAILDGTQNGAPLPKGRWDAIQAPVRVMVGGKSESFFHSGARALAGELQHASYQALPGADHGAVMNAPGELASAVSEFFMRPERAPGVVAGVTPG